MSEEAETYRGNCDMQLVLEPFLVFFLTVEEDEFFELKNEFYKLASELLRKVAPGPERKAGLRKLLESRDCMVRAMKHPRR